MTNKTITIIGIVFLLGVVSSMYAGECEEVDLSGMESTDDVFYTVVGNSSNLEGLTIDLNKTTAIANICTVPNYSPDSFTIIFIDNSTQEVYIEVPVYKRSSGGTSIIYIQNKTVVEVPTYVDREVIVLNNTRDEIFITKDDLDQQDLTIMDKVYDLLIWIVIIIIILGSILFYFIRRKMKGGKKIMEEDMNGEMDEEGPEKEEERFEEYNEEDLGLDNE